MLDVDARRHAPATLRNSEPIRDVLAGLLRPGDRVLEVAAGTGEHAVFFARAFPEIAWQPTDADPASLASIAAWAAEAACENLRPPLHLDARADAWPPLADAPFDAVLAINLIHIAPWSACLGLMAGAAAVLRPGGALILYGAFMVDGCHTAPSNAEFDRSLKAMDPRYGVRDIAAVVGEAASRGFELRAQIAMPANNITLVFGLTGR